MSKFAFNSQIGTVYSSVNQETGEVVKTCDLDKLLVRIAFAVKLEENGTPKLYISDNGDVKVCFQSEDKSLFVFMLKSTYDEKLKLKDIAGIGAIVSSKKIQNGPRIWFGVEPILAPSADDL